MKHANISLFVPHVGCPCKCSFCDQRAITGGAKPPSPEDVMAAARVAAQSLSQPTSAEIAFFGGSFTAIPREYMLSLLEAGQRAVKEFHFSGIRCSTRPDAVTPEIIEILRRYGVTAVELGAQSMDDGVLAANRRGHTAGQTERAAGLISAGGLELGVQMMTGLYTATPEKDRETMTRLIALHPSTVRVYPTVVLEGTELADLYKRGLYSPQTLEEAVELCAGLLDSFEKAGVKVIRMGLHAEGDVEINRVAGPYHPAFKQLVESRRFLQSLLACLQDKGRGDYTVEVSPRELSTAVGQRKGNQKLLEQAGYFVKFKPGDGVESGRFRLIQEFPF